MKLILYPRSYSLKPVILLVYYLGILLAAFIFEKLVGYTFGSLIELSPGIDGFLNLVPGLFLGIGSGFLGLIYILDLNLSAKWISPRRYDFWGSIMFFTTLALSLVSLIPSYFTPGQVLVGLSSTGLFAVLLGTSDHGDPPEYLWMNTITFAVIYCGLLIATLFSAHRARSRPQDT